jgi:hypothetical protein
MSEEAPVEVKEEWKTISGFMNYMISNKGRVLSVNRRVILKTQARHGHHCVRAWKNGEQHYLNVGRLVFKAFGVGYNEDYSLAYIDGNKDNLNVENLKMSHKKKPSGRKVGKRD